MINTVAEFLEQFKQFALSKIEEEDKDIKHTVAIGDNFEGLTAELLGKAIFKDLNLRMVERSFIYNDSGVISDELDCLLVVGNGQKMSFANRYKYHINDVIAVIQVKKNLYANDIDSSHHNLRSIFDVSEPRDAEPFVGRLLRDAYRLLTSKELPTRERRERFTDRENIIYHYLMMEAFHPLRIVLGYYGYTTEYGLREGFIKKLEEVVKEGPVRGYSPGSFPSLYICGNSTIIKNNGMPMGIPFTDDEFYFPVLTSSSGKPMYHLLELIWTRLSYKFGISSNIFGNDHDIEAAHPFISCKEKKINEDNWGWEFIYHPLTRKQLSVPLVAKPWAPIEVDKNQYTFLHVLSRQGTIDIVADKQFKKFIEVNSLDADQFIKSLLETKLIYVDEGKAGLLVDELHTVFCPDGKVYAGENKSGEMASYFLKKWAEEKKE
ncbi:DUF6602 domain-containing protein [Parafilimonas terrae]|uniref:DUF6602 domain-containing protein n=1 Tax=Parafilimonas terrae TaxID=1465490 RepID=A0A1I5TAH8_9BACT|nr:DUF6602 domain-containing protein [Parafilimonas terrae]SFP80053.1 hypothetical protein SAMN05444277_10219 [Parafilimonas terrae]